MSYPPPGGPPPTGARPGHTSTPSYGGYAPPPGPPGPPGQQSYYGNPPPAPQGPGGTSSYYPPPPGAPGSAPPLPTAYPTGGSSYHPPPPGPPPGQYPPYGAPSPGGYGAYPPPSGAPPPAGQYPPPTGAPPSVAPPGKYPPPPGPPPGWTGPPGGYGVGVGAHAPSGHAPPPGPPPGHPPPGAHHAHTPSSSYPGGPTAPSPYPPGAHAAPADPLVYLETAIPNPNVPPAAHGVQKVPGWDPSHDYNSLQRAVLVEPVNEGQLMRILRPLNVFQMDALNDYTISKEGTTLADKIDKKTSGNFGFALRALTLGPLGFDVDLARRAIAGMGTNEFLLVELIMGRSGPEIRWLKTGYRLKYGKDLTEAVKSDVSGKLERMFVMALNTQKPANEPYIDYAKVDADVTVLSNAAKKKDETPFFEILINRSNVHLGSVIERFNAKYKSLSKVIKKAFSGIIEKALLHIVHGVKPKRDRQGIWRDAKLLEASMAGIGTKDTQLIYRLVRAHWNPQRMEAVKAAYKNRYGKTLESRVKGETSGPYRELLLQIVRSSEGPKK